MEKKITNKEKLEIITRVAKLFGIDANTESKIVKNGDIITRYHLRDLKHLMDGFKAT